MYIKDTYRENSVFYKILLDDAAKYREKQLEGLYNEAKRNVVRVIPTNRYLNSEAGDRLIRMAQIEAGKEKEMLRYLFGIDLGIQLTNRNDVRQLVEAINSAFHFKRIAERNANMIKSPDFRSGIKAVFSYFPGYFLQAFKDKRDTIIEETITNWTNNKNMPIGDVAKSVFESYLSEMTYDAVKRMLGRAKVERSADSKYQDAYKEIVDAISADFLSKRNNIFLERLTSIYGLDKLSDSFKEFFENQDLKNSIDSSAASRAIRDEISKGIHKKGGFTFEALIDQCLGMVASELDGTTAADGSTISVSHLKNFGALNARPDNVLAVNIPDYLLDSTINKIEKAGIGKTRTDDADALMELMHKIKDVKNGYIIYFNDKNYNIGKNSVAHQAAEDVKLEDLGLILQFSNINVNQLIYNILQATKGGVNEGDTSDAEEVIAQEVAYFLFDDWGSIGYADSGKAIHIMALEGIMIPLSAFLFAMGTAINEAKSHVSSFAKATISLTEIIYGEGVKEEGSNRGARFVKENWTNQANYALENTKIRVTFLQSMQQFVSSYVKG